MATRYKFNYGKFFRTIIVLLCLVALIRFGKDVFERHFFNTRLTVIPDVINLDKKDAIKYLKKAGLKVKVINSKVPNIIGLELLEARSRLKGQNIQIETIDYYPSNQKYNTILGVYPKPGTKLEINQKISILVSSQQMVDPSVMPNITGLDLNDARELLKQIGLDIGNISRTNDPTLPVNTIISTNPVAGTKIQRGQKVSIVLNTGAAPKKRERSTEEIINQSQEEIDNQEIEKIIDNTINKMDQQGTEQKNNGNTQSPPRNNTQGGGNNNDSGGDEDSDE